jgi:hypothetical protein
VKLRYNIHIEIVNLTNRGKKMQFIKTYENAMSEQLMQELRDWADRPSLELHMSEQEGETQFPYGKLGREDHQKFLKFSNSDLMMRCNEELNPCIKDYSENFPGVSGAISYDIKLQKTPVKGGYSVWHSEQGEGHGATRVVSWMLYLNDVEEGGETEFLYQGFRQKATKGTLVIWPAAFTHTHRGNPPYSNDKYVITGWANFPYETVPN